MFASTTSKTPSVLGVNCLILELRRLESRERLQQFKVSTRKRFVLLRLLATSPSFHREGYSYICLHPEKSSVGLPKAGRCDVVIKAVTYVPAIDSSIFS